MPAALQLPFQGLRIIAPAGATDATKHGFDIVAVPGLGADPETSFESESSHGFNWLTDETHGILSFVPDARILRFHYDSRWRGAKAVPQTPSNAANSLLDALVQRRENDQKRPLIFLAHSMGGLVVAKSLVLAAAYPENLKRTRINECFAGAIFFGSPFRGTNEAAKALLLQQLLALSTQPPNQMLVILDPENDALAELRNSFAQIATKEPKPGIVCLYELRKTNYLSISKPLSSRLHFPHFDEVVVTEQSAVLDFAPKVGMECDHRQLNRFDRKSDDGRYNVVRAHLSEIVLKARITVKKRLNASPQSVVSDVLFKRLITVLDIAGFRSCRQKVEIASGESQWILADSRYRDWGAGTNESGTRPCFWVSGNEGVGKAKTALSVVQNLETIEEQEPKTNDIVVVWFFCDSNETTQSAEILLKSLILQLIIKRRLLAQYVAGFVPQARHAGASTAAPTVSVDRLWSALFKMLEDPSTPETFFVINGMHLLNPDHKSTALFLLALQRDFIDKPDGNNVNAARSKAKWLILSRDRSHIKHALLSNNESATTWINLADETKSAELSDELNKYIRARVEALSRKMDYGLALQFFVSSFLQQHAENNQLWVDIVCLLLEGISSNPVSVCKTIEDLPSDLDKLITQLWSRSLESRTEGIDTIKEILRTLAIVKEDPTLDELKVLAGIIRDKTDRNIDKVDHPTYGEADEYQDAEYVLALVKSCGPLLRVYCPEIDDFAPLGWHKVAFIHPLAKTHLLKNSESRKAIGFSSDGDLHGEIQWQHGVIALRCFSYTLDRLSLRQPSINWNELTSDRGSLEKNTADNELDAIFPADDNVAEDLEDGWQSSMLRYPVRYWLEHGQESTLDFVRALDLRHLFWHVPSEPRRRWWRNFTHATPLQGLEDLTPMHIASYFGLLPLLNELLRSDHKAEINNFDSWDRQPLHWAAGNGRVAVMDCLISAGADINNAGQGKTDQNGRLARGWTPLHMAASAGKTEAVKLLFDKGSVELDFVSDHVGTALCLAIASNQISTAELLLEKGASPVLAEAAADSPVTLAVLGGHVPLLVALLGKGGAQNMTSIDYGTSLAAAASRGDPITVDHLLLHDNSEESHEKALIEAAASGHRMIVRMMIKRSPQINRDKAFIAAASGGHESVLQEFWPRNSSKSITRQALDSALYEATCAEQESVVEILLDVYHADPDATGRAFGNTITAAAFEGNQNILDRLIRSGANVNAPAGYPLQAAASHGFYDIAKALLEARAYPSAESTAWPDRTALQSACSNGHYDIAKILLESGANPNVGGGVYTFPIIAAVTRGNARLLRLLLQHHADVNVSGGKDCSTALIKAVVTLPGEDFEELLKANAKMDNLDHNGDTALIVAAKYENIRCVNNLLKYRALVDHCGNDGTALHAAACNGNSEICRRLLQAGAKVKWRGGPYDTIVQAAAASGDETTLRVILEAMDKQKSNLLEAEGGCFFTALHAASAQKNDSCLRLLLAREPRLDIHSRSPSSRGTPLQVAIYARCNRNARLLLDAGANVEHEADGRGGVLQAVAIRGCRELVSLLIQHGANAQYRGNKYQNPLVAAVVRDFHEDNTDMLEELFEQSFDASAYRQALNKAFWLKRRDAFELLWKSAKSSKKLMLNTKQLLSYYQAKAHTVRRQKEVEAEQHNSDFDDKGLDSGQHIGDEDDELQQDDASDADDDALQTQSSGAEIPSQAGQDDVDVMQNDQIDDDQNDSVTEQDPSDDKEGDMHVEQDPNLDTQNSQASGDQLAQDDEDVDDTDDNALLNSGNVNNTNRNDVIGTDGGGNETSIDDDISNTSCGNSNIESSNELVNDNGDVVPSALPRSRMENSDVLANDSGGEDPPAPPSGYGIARRPARSSPHAKHRQSQPAHSPRTLIDEASVDSDDYDNAGDGFNDQGDSDSSASQPAPQPTANPQDAEQHNRREVSQKIDRQEPRSGKNLTNSVSTTEAAIQDLVDATLCESVHEGSQNQTQASQSSKPPEKPPPIVRRSLLEKFISKGIDVASAVTQVPLRTTQLDGVENDAQAQEESATGKVRGWLNRGKASHRSTDIISTITQVVEDAVQLDETINDEQTSQTSNTPGEPSTSRKARAHPRQKKKRKTTSSGFKIIGTVTEQLLNLANNDSQESLVSNLFD